MEFLIHYQRYNPITKKWEGHSYTVRGPSQLIKAMFDYSWQVVAGEVIVLGIRKVDE